jgi:glutaconyl-CoA/methylmalonyl-CoA decarboxylase subunit gamma
MSKFKYTIDGKEYNVEIGEVNDTTAEVTVNGETFSVELEKQAEPEKKKPVLGQPAKEESDSETTPVANINANNALRAPLPGVVTDIKVEVGQEVSAGDTLVVLEAMKMANNLEAEKSGKVTAICVKVGESVMEDTPLVVVE